VKRPKLFHKRTRPKRPKAAKVIKSRQLFRDAVKDVRTNWKSYILILAIVTIPSDVVSLALSLGSSDLTEAYLSCAAVIMNVALLWAIARTGERKEAPSFGEAYYAGSEAIVRYALISVGIIAMLIPFAFGASLYSNGLQTSQLSGLSPIVLVFIGLVSLLVASPSAYLMIRYSLAPIAAVQDGLRPIAALKRARRVTLGRFWPVTLRLLFLAVIAACVLIPIGLLTLGMSVLHMGVVATGFFEIASTLIGLPLINAYLFHLYRDLRDTAAPERLSVDDPAEVAIEAGE
jgi:hypothetical protein